MIELTPQEATELESMRGRDILELQTMKSSYTPVELLDALYNGYHVKGVELDSELQILHPEEARAIENTRSCHKGLINQVRQVRRRYQLLDGFTQDEIIQLFKVGYTVKVKEEEQL